jgi:hypothetical protein
MKEPVRTYTSVSNVITLDEQSLIVAVRANMARLLYLAKQHHSNYLTQFGAYIADINAPNIDGTFTRMEAQKGLLQEAYEPVRCGIVKEMKRYDDYCANKKMPYSVEWDKLLKDLQPHLNGISMLGWVTSS